MPPEPPKHQYLLTGPIPPRSDLRHLHSLDEATRQPRGRSHRSQNANIINDINNKKDEDDDGGSTTKRELGVNRAGVVGGDKRHRSSSDLDQEEQEEEEIQKSVDKGAGGGRGDRKYKKDSSE